MHRIRKVSTLFSFKKFCSDSHFRHAAYLMHTDTQMQKMTNCLKCIVDNSSIKPEMLKRNVTGIR